MIESYELAFRMQGELPEVMDIANESEATQGSLRHRSDGDRPTSAGNVCWPGALSRPGVRFVELCHGGWDQHRNLKADHGKHAHAIDQPIAGLLTDLKARGLLEDTLVIWGGEFGRTPYAQNGDGRDHNNKGYTLWMAGGGVKPGTRVRPDRRLRLRGRRKPGARARLARDDPAPSWPRSREAHLPIRRPRDAADGRQGARGVRSPCLNMRLPRRRAARYFTTFTTGKVMKECITILVDLRLR